jgi:hypothetical protein
VFLSRKRQSSGKGIKGKTEERGPHRSLTWTGIYLLLEPGINLKKADLATAYLLILGTTLGTTRHYSSPSLDKCANLWDSESQLPLPSNGLTLMLVTVPSSRHLALISHPSGLREDSWKPFGRRSRNIAHLDYFSGRKTARFRTSCDENEAGWSAPERVESRELLPTLQK